MFWSFLLGFIGIGLLARLAVQHGEVKHDRSNEELRHLSRRGRLLALLMWPFVAAFVLAIFPNVPSRNLFSDMVLVVGAVLPTVLLAFLVNTILERTPFRIKKP